MNEVQLKISKSQCYKVLNIFTIIAHNNFVLIFCNQFQ